MITKVLHVEIVISDEGEGPYISGVRVDGILLPEGDGGLDGGQTFEIYSQNDSMVDRFDVRLETSY